MKIRDGFVSNSSSSSFIVISPGKCEPPKLDGPVYIGLNHGHTEFGWNHEKFDDFESKLNFAYLQTTYVGLEQGAEWQKMLDKVLKEETGCSQVTTGGVMRGYIDHQSAASEGMNTEMFDNEERLKQFLFCPDSYIETDNDNG